MEARPDGGDGRAPSRILVVDDDNLTRSLLAWGIEQQGHKVTTAEHGRHALELLRSEPQDLVLLDYLMPELDGPETLRQIRADPALSHIPVIMVSALDETDEMARCIEMGAEDYLPKPFNPVILRARIGACLQRKFFRDQEIAYLRGVDRIAEAAAAIEAETFDPASLDEIAARPDSLGRLARVFQEMAGQIADREQALRKQLQDLHYVFISYASVDRERALAIVGQLEAAGIRTWIDQREIGGGTNYGAEIVSSIRNAAVVAVVCSEASLASRNVRQEIQIAWKYQRPYLPLLLDTTPIPDELTYWLEGFQWIEVLEHPPAVWMPRVLAALDRLGLTRPVG